MLLATLATTPAIAKKVKPKLALLVHKQPVCNITACASHPLKRKITNAMANIANIFPIKLMGSSILLLL